jgi:hypothetical protein
MRIGIDLDNTIIDYTEAFLFGARELKFIPEKWKGQKIELKSVVKSHSEGELKWQKLQGKVYGQWIHHAKLYSGVFRFLWRSHQRGWETIVVSHKTEHGHFDSDKISLRDSAMEFLLSCQVCESDGEGLLNKIKFESTREQKIQTINDYQCDVFIDDLQEVLENREFPLETQRILFDPEYQYKTTTLERAHSWDDVATVLLGEWSELELKNLSESCGLPAVREVKSMSGGGNSRVFKGYAEAGNEFALKIYPADSAHDRLRSEYDGMSTIHSKCTPKAPVPIGVNRALETAAFGWVDGETISKPAFEDIDQAVEFLSSLYQCRHKIEFDNFPCASAACLSGKQIEEQINWRLELLLTEQNKSLTLFLNKDFIVAFEQVLERAKAMWPNREYDVIINRDQQILSPSDFGFHNALRKKNGSLVFLDFEYFGWDDPVKLMCDFAFHPGMVLSIEMRKYWFQVSLKLYGEGLIPRLNASWPLYGLCWVLILLNEFRGDIWKRRCAADPTIVDTREDLQQLQFERSRNLLKFIDLSVKKQTFDFI